MKDWKNKLVVGLFALSGVAALVPSVKRVIKGEPLDEVAVTFLCLAVVWLVLAVVVGRKSGSGSERPGAKAAGVSERPGMNERKIGDTQGFRAESPRW